MSNLQIDINCDLGESVGQHIVGQDEKVFPFITSCNIACGFHGGDPTHMENTIKNALKYNVQIGAHPSYPDKAGFGRRKMKLDAEELKTMLKVQINTLTSMTESLGGKVSYVKPHGALYNTAADDKEEAYVIVEAIKEIDNELALLGMAGSEMQTVAQNQGISFFAEAFADRKYNAKGRLLSRNQPGSVIEDPKEAAAQVMSLVLDQQVYSNQGTSIAVNAHSICVHGDNAQAVVILQAIDQALQERKIVKKAFSE